MSIPDKNILTYIKDSLAQDFSRSQINEALLSSGWGIGEIEEAFRYLENSNENKVITQTEAVSIDNTDLNNKENSENNHKILKIIIILTIIIIAVSVSVAVFFTLSNKKTNTLSKNIPESKVVLSNINYSMVPFSKLINYKSKSISFEISNPKLAKKVCVVSNYYRFNNVNNDLSGFDTICNPYLDKGNGLYSDSVFFDNLIGIISRDYLNNQSIDHIVMQFYVKDIDGKESNRLDFTLKNDKDSVKKNMAATTINKVSNSPVVSNTISNNNTKQTTATVTVNGVTNLDAKIKDKISFVWNSSNGDTFSMVNATMGCSDPTYNEVKKTDSIPSSGAGTTVLPDSLAGCTVVYTFTVSNTTTGKVVTTKATIKISPMGK